MARFRGTVHGGQGGEASRLGLRHITTDANGWHVGVNVDGGGDRVKTDDDHFTIYATGGSNESHGSLKIAEVAEIDGERRITLFDAEGHIVAQFVA